MSPSGKRIPTIFKSGSLAVAGLTAVAAVALQFSPADAANQIILTGSIAQNCTMNVTPDPAALTLNLTGGNQRVTVGTVAQSCNKKAGYTLTVTSANCAASPTGAKLIGTAGGENVGYSVESQNPTTGGSQANVTGLLQSSCSNQVARNVTSSKINAENSTVFVNYTGNATLGADTYQDTLTFTMTVK